MVRHLPRRHVRELRRRCRSSRSRRSASLVGPWTHTATRAPYAGDVVVRRRRSDRRLRHRLAPSLVRSLPQGRGDRRRERCAGPALRHGHRRRPQGRRRATLPRRLLARRDRVAARRHAHGAVLLPRRRLAQHRRSRRSRRRRTTYTFDPRHPVPTIGGGSSARLKDGAYDQREDHARSRRRQPPYLPLRSRADVRRLPDRAAGGGHGGHRADQGRALRVVEPHRHRLHRQADRRLSAERRLARRLRPEPHGRDRPRPLSRDARSRR